MKKQSSIKGKVKFVSCSPHGDPEGVVLEDGAFVKIPPHSLLAKQMINVGAVIEGTGELLMEKPNQVYHHAKLTIDGTMISDDSLSDKKKEKLKEKHKEDLKNREDAPSKKTTFKGSIVSIGAKPKGEIDRLIFSDGTSVHIGKESKLFAKDIQIGDKFEVKGSERIYGKSRFIKAESVKHI